MEYKLTFEDGSEAFLAHYGVKGMKWGVRRARNKELKSKYKAAIAKSSSIFDKESASGKYDSHEASRRAGNAAYEHHLNYRKNVKLGNAKAYREAAKSASKPKQAAKYEKKAQKQEAAAKRFSEEAAKSKTYHETTNKGYDRASSLEKTAMPLLNQTYANRYLHTRANNSALTSTGKMLVSYCMDPDRPSLRR